MAPRKRGGGGGGRGGLSFIFCCFNGSDHPEITYRLREDFALQAMEPALPMPGYDELDGMFSELVVSRSWRNTGHSILDASQLNVTLNSLMSCTAALGPRFLISSNITLGTRFLTSHHVP